MEERKIPEDLSVDPATIDAIGRTRELGLETIWDRFEEMKRCRFGRLALCCFHCTMGPCRVAEGEKEKVGICGATAATIVARNLVRKIAAGSAAHSDHGRAVAEVLLRSATGSQTGFAIRDEGKLLALAEEYGIRRDGRPIAAVAQDVAERALLEFGQQHGELVFPRHAPRPRVETWRRLDLMPRGIDREIVEGLHRTTMGVDHDPKSLLLHGLRTALADGWGGAMIGTEMSDVLFGGPVPIRARANLGVLSRTDVNIIVHGHEPLLPDLIVQAAGDPEMIQRARAAGATGINLCGMCCTANEILMRRGIPSAGSFIQQELALGTGAVEAMVVDVQCILPSITRTAGCFHTEIISTSPRARFEGATAIEYTEEKGMDVAREIVRRAVDNYPRRDPSKVWIPEGEMDLVAGFTMEIVYRILGGTFRATYRPLNDNIINGRIRGIGAVIGCNTPATKHAHGHVELVKELIRRDVLVVQTGCAAISCAREGLLAPEAAGRLAGPGLAEVCEAVGIPPVLHLGSCVDNSRILNTACHIVREGGLGDDLSDLPVAGAAPEWMSEKAIAIGHYFVASGFLVVLGHPLPIEGSPRVTDFLCREVEGLTGGRFAFEPDPVRAAQIMLEHIERKRDALGINRPLERKLFDMEDRRKLDV